MIKSPPIAAPRRTRDPETKRAALLDAALHLFTEEGYENVSIADIAKRAGIAVGTVYRFYDNKITLLRAMLESLEDEFVVQMQSDWSQGGDYSARLERVCLGLFTLSEKRKPLLRLMSMTTDIVYADSSLPGDRIQAQIRLMYGDGLRDGAFLNGDIPLMASMAHGLVEGAMMGWMRNSGLSAADAAGQLASVMKSGFVKNQRS
ncbi:TetR/AcrR family transcriptional regulator [Roseibium sp. HPY-6]|uniref:TetR/AcrR family transcriptional regulator n=1 Tax=Roseibium sp. HPY-6 TaxID=3229852 RepID=UPI00338F26A3